MERDDIVSQAYALAETELRLAIRRAYDAGMQAGYSKAKEDMKARLAGVLDDAEATPSPKGLSSNRAEPGSVRPAIESAMADAGRGQTAKQVVTRVHAMGHSSIKESTVRATLNKMKVARKVTKVGNLWHLGGPSQDGNHGTANGKFANGGGTSQPAILIGR